MRLSLRAGQQEAVANTKAEAPIFTMDPTNQGLDYLVQLVKEIRPKNPAHIKEAEQNFKALFARFQGDKQALISLRVALRSQFLKRNFVPALTQSGMPESGGFLQELTQKFKHKLLPPLLEEEDFLYVINHVFYKSKDYLWVRGIDRKLWTDLFELLGFQLSGANEDIIQELNEALHILTQRAVTLGLEKEVIGSYLNINYREYPFFLLDQAVQRYLSCSYNQEDGALIAGALAKVVEALHRCKERIQEVSQERATRGTSLSQTYILIRIEHHLERLLLVTDLLDCDHCFNADRFLDYFIRVISYEKKRNSIREFISANLGFLTYKITEHGGTRGKKYMTITRQEYWSMIRSSMGGGLIVSFTALIKNLISKYSFPPFWQGFFYSVNYAASFQAMHESRTTLATKQPAYTASAIATSVDYFRAYEKGGLYVIAIIIARTVRTQLASFFGNLVIVFPMGYALAAFYHWATGRLLMNGQTAMTILEEQHPYHSLSLLYACFTGFFLFLSGLIGGYVENGINYGNIGERLRHSPFLKNTIAPRKLERISRYVVNNMGALVGNVALGFFLGMSGVLGKIFGIPFDIRHITISSGNAAMAYYTTGNAPGTGFLLTVFAGILMIGFLNFLVSFALAFTVAVRSRGVRLRDYPELLAVVAKFFLRFPLDFVYPPKTEMRKNLM